MIYEIYQAQSDMLDPLRAAARGTATVLRNPMLSGLSAFYPYRAFTAAFDVFGHTRLTHERPPFDIKSVTVGNREVPVTEVKEFSTPFGTLLHFKKDVGVAQPPVLVVAPLSGHFATLLRGTVITLLQDHDVYITDWHNARDVPVSAGRFGFDEYVEHVITFLEKIGTPGHLVAVCQPCVHALVAVCVMAMNGNPMQPRSMTLMAGPIDCRVNPTVVNKLATDNPIEWFEKNLIATVPRRLKGGGRKVYPGFTQLSAFMSMNADRHVKSHRELYNNLAKGEWEKAEQTRTFYDEYFAVLDLTAEFYLETVNRVFQEYELPLGKMYWKGQKVDPTAVRKTALFTVEGERDDICSVGQTVAAHDLCTKIRPYQKSHHLQPGVGHYGVFNGKKWEGQIYPRVKNMILAND